MGIPLLRTIYLRCHLSSLSSPIPQFILDASHPWIRENKRFIGRQGDAAQLLCALNSTLRPNQTVSTNGGRAYPVDLFNRLEIDNRYNSRPGWANTVARLREMLDCPAALLDATELNIDIEVHRGFSFEPKEEPHDPPAALPGLFVDALLAMSNLRTLYWGVPARQTRLFEPVFVARNLTLPNVSDLHVGAYSEYMVGICPGMDNLQELDMHSWLRYPDARLLLIRAAASAANLTRFGIQGWFEGWNATLLEEIPAAMPNLSRIDVLRGGLGSNYDGDHTGEQLTKFVGVLAKFPKLVYLSLPYSAYLGVGFDGGPWCGNAFFGPGGRDYERQVSKDGAAATDMAAKIVVQGLPNLVTLSIGAMEGNITMDADGRTVTWPWTGRMDEWAWEMVPYADDILE